MCTLVMEPISDVFFRSGLILVSILVVLLNGVFMITLVRKRSLHTPSNAVLGCLCCSDIMIGMLSCTLFTLNFLENNIGIHKVVIFLIVKLYLLFISISSLFMTLVNLDRYAAICHPFKYIRCATAKRFAVISASTCSIYAGIVLCSFAIDSIYRIHSDSVIFMISVFSISLILITCNCRILRVIYIHRRSIASLSRIRNGCHTGIERETKRYRFTVLLIVLFVLCKLPPVIDYGLHVMWRVKANEVMTTLSKFSAYLLLLNSLFNPILYYVRIKAFREAMKVVFCPQRPI